MPWSTTAPPYGALAIVPVAPPLTCGQAEFDEMEKILRQTLTEAQNLI